MSSKEIITILSRLDVPVANHMSVMDDDMVHKVEQFFKDVKQRAAERHATEVQREMREKQRARERAAARASQEANSTRLGGSRGDETDSGSAAAASRPAPNRADAGNSARPARTDRPAEQSRPASEQRRDSGRPPMHGNGNTQASNQQRDGRSNSERPGGERRPYNNSNGQSGDRRPYNGGSGSTSGGRPQGQGGFGGNRPDRQGGGRPQGGQSGQGGYSRQGGGRPQSGGFNRQGGAGGGGRPNSAVPIPAAGAPNPGRKAKEKPRANQFDKKEKFNEDKLLGRGGNQRRRGRGGHNQGGQAQPPRRAELPKEISVEGPMTVGEFAKLLRREASEIIKKLMSLGVMATINQEIDTDAMELIATDWNVEFHLVEPVDEEALDMLINEEEDAPELLEPRPPVVTIMGHVDHGKTTLLDAIRDSRVVASESGGITQHIGAYQVELNNRKITFLDTPGHEAFTTMRARGAQVTDVTILVVAADDGVMPQTVEAINHAKAADVPIIVAVNKIDKPGANPDRVKQELAQYDLAPEEWGGSTVFVEISALQRTGLDELLEMVLLVADVQELKANPKARPRGTVIEAQLDKGRGPVATVLVQKGTLKVGDIVVAGTTYGKVRAMINDHGKRVKEAGPSTPVEIQGLGEVPSAGDLFVVYDDERSARNLVQKRTSREKAEQLDNTSRVTLDDLYKQIQEGNVKDLNVIVKADVQGSVEALVGAIEKIEVEGIRVHVIHKGAGAITESDVSLASASNAIIIGFHVRPDANAKRAAEEQSVDIRLHRVIYNAIEELEAAMKGMLDPEYKEVVLGHAEVREVFHISRVGSVAGCYVTDGKVTRDSEARLIRDGVVIYEGKLDTLKRFKDDAREVAQGFECGLTLDKFNDIKVGDVIEAFRMEAVKVH